MAKEILLYSGIYDYTAAAFIREMNNAANEDVVVRLNTRGGSPEDSYGIIAKMKERKTGVKLKVDGLAYSTGFFMLAYADKVEALDVSKGMLHRAGYPDWVESDLNLFTQSRKDNLNRINSEARKALEVKMNTEKFKEITGKTLDDIFSLDKREEVYLSAQQMKEIGLVDEIVNITPEITAEVETFKAMAYGAEYPIATKETVTKTEHRKTKFMNIQELRSAHAELVAQIEAAAVAQERDRVKAWMAFTDIDAKAVKEGIDGGKNIGQAEMAEFVRKSVSADALAGLEAGKQKPVTTEEPKPVSAEAKDIENFHKEVKQHLKDNY